MIGCDKTKNSMFKNDKKKEKKNSNITKNTFFLLNLNLNEYSKIFSTTFLLVS